MGKLEQVILAFHSIVTAYGFWLPNEPRGSWSDFVASWELLRFGPATKVQTRQSLANVPHDPKHKQQMQAALKHPPVRFTGEMAVEIASAFGQTPYTIHALAILPEHVHLVISHEQRHIRKIIGHMKSDATRTMRDAGHFVEYSPWTHHGWNVYLNTDEAVWNAIGYVEENPVREGLKPQRWSCVTPYDPAVNREAEARRKRRG